MNKSPAALYIVATPIGHLDDMGSRALQTLSSVAFVLAEDTRRTGVLLRHFGISVPMRSVHEHNEASRVEWVVEQLLGGSSLALVSDAGTPLVSDPGYRLVRAVQGAGCTVVPIPGPSAVTTALSAAGLATDRFCFEGFLPPRDAARRERLGALVTESRTTVFFESAKRIETTLEAMAQAFGEEIGRAQV